MKKIIVAKTLIIMAMSTALLISFAAIKDSSSTISNQCGQTPPNYEYNAYIIGCLILLLALGLTLLLKPPHKIKWIIISASGMIVLLILNVIISFVAALSHGLCIPF